jgi:hypothetical protein
MREITIDLTLKLRIQRCYRCNRYWSHEANAAAMCPMCKSTAFDDIATELEESKRRSASLLGQVTKLKKKIKEMKDG